MHSFALLLLSSGSPILAMPWVSRSDVSLQQIFQVWPPIACLTRLPCRNPDPAYSHHHFQSAIGHRQTRVWGVAIKAERVCRSVVLRALYVCVRLLRRESYTREQVCWLPTHWVVVGTGGGGGWRGCWVGSTQCSAIFTCHNPLWNGYHRRLRCWLHFALIFFLERAALQMRVLTSCPLTTNHIAG